MQLSALKTLALATAASLCLGVSGMALAQQPAAPAPRVLKIQTTWPPASTLQENSKFFSEQIRLCSLSTSGSTKYCNYH